MTALRSHTFDDRYCDGYGWLATSPKQIKDLWKKVDDMLGGEQTELQREALAIEPVEESR